MFFDINAFGVSKHSWLLKILEGNSRNLKFCILLHWSNWCLETLKHLHFSEKSSNYHLHPVLLCNSGTAWIAVSSIILSKHLSSSNNVLPVCGSDSKLGRGNRGRPDSFFASDTNLFSKTTGRMYKPVCYIIPFEVQPNSQKRSQGFNQSISWSFCKEFRRERWLYWDTQKPSRPFAVRDNLVCMWHDSLKGLSTQFYSKDFYSIHLEDQLLPPANLSIWFRTSKQHFLHNFGSLHPLLQDSLWQLHSKTQSQATARHGSPAEQSWHPHTDAVLTRLNTSDSGRHHINTGGISGQPQTRGLRSPPGCSPERSALPSAGPARSHPRGSPRPHLPVSAGVAAAMARVDLVPAEAAQLDPARERRVRGGRGLPGEAAGTPRRPPRGGWARIAADGALTSWWRRLREAREAERTPGGDVGSGARSPTGAEREGQGRARPGRAAPPRPALAAPRGLRGALTSPGYPGTAPDAGPAALPSIKSVARPWWSGLACLALGCPVVLSSVGHGGSRRCSHGGGWGGRSG